MFDHLKTREIAGKTVWLQIPYVGEGSCLQLRSATDSNKPYQNAMLKKAANRGRGVSGAAGRRLEVEQSRLDDRELYPVHVVSDWMGIVDDQGNTVPFSIEAATEFFKQIPSWILDRIRLFCMQPENFLTEQGPLPDHEELSGNSQSDSSGS